MMNKKEDSKINLESLMRSIEANSDFAMEMQVLSELLKIPGVSQKNVQHSGTYVDPLTNKFRQFDFRFSFEIAFPRDEDNLAKNRVYLAVECKNLNDNLLIHCSQRRENEDFHNLLVSSKVDAVRVHRVKHSREMKEKIYPFGAYVGKSMDQFNFKNDKVILKGDEVTFNMMSQALSSSNELIQKAYNEIGRSQLSESLSVVIPWLVIPDKKLWQLNYKPDGSTCGQPKQVSHVQYGVFKDWELMRSSLEGKKKTLFCISHIEIMTFSHIQNWVEDFLSEENFSKVFTVPDWREVRPK